MVAPTIAAPSDEPAEHHRERHDQRQSPGEEADADPRYFGKTYVFDDMPE
jgi:hypothetical protein